MRIIVVILFSALALAQALVLPEESKTKDILASKFEDMATAMTTSMATGVVMGVDVDMDMDMARGRLRLLLLLPLKIRIVAHLLMSEVLAV